MSRLSGNAEVSWIGGKVGTAGRLCENSRLQALSLSSFSQSTPKTARLGERLQISGVFSQAHKLSGVFTQPPGIPALRPSYANCWYPRIAQITRLVCGHFQSRTANAMCSAPHFNPAARPRDHLLKGSDYGVEADFGQSQICRLGASWARPPMPLKSVVYWSGKIKIGAGKLENGSAMRSLMCGMA